MQPLLLYVYVPVLLYVYVPLFFVGDEILEVNGESLHGLTHLQAIQTFKVHFIDAVWS